MSYSSEHSSENSLSGPDGNVISERQLEISKLGRDFSQYTKDANFCTYFKIVHNKKDIENDIKEGTFFPDFVHQFFTTSERIFGYKEPILRLFYTPSRLKAYLKFDYNDKLNKDRDGIEADNVIEMLNPVLETIDFTQDLDHFIKEVDSKEETEFVPCGNLIGSFTGQYKKPSMLSRAQLEQIEMLGDNHSNPSLNSNGIGQNTANNCANHTLENFNGDHSSNQPLLKKSYQFFHANSDTKGFDKIQAQMQSLIMWFIESATMVDYEDPRWDFFVVYEKYNPKSAESLDAVEISTEDRYFFAGYATVYRYYAYPDKIRPRVSQMLIIPPYRRNGLGTALLNAIYDFYKPNEATLDITVEDPDEEFIAMRDFLDCKNCLNLPQFQPDQLKKGWSPEMAKEAQNQLKLCQRQSRKVYEILKLRSIDDSDEEELKNYRLEIKNRLNIPQQRLKLEIDKVVKRGYDMPEEMKLQRDNQKLSLAQLDENYQELVKQYHHTIGKLNTIKPLIN